MLWHKYIGGGPLKEKHTLQKLFKRGGTLIFEDGRISGRLWCSIVKLEGKHSYMVDVFPLPKVT